MTLYRSSETFELQWQAGGEIEAVCRFAKQVNRSLIHQNFTMGSFRAQSGGQIHWGTDQRGRRQLSWRPAKVFEANQWQYHHHGHYDGNPDNGQENGLFSTGSRRTVRQ